MNILIASSISKHAIEKLEQKHNVICAFNESPEKLSSLIRDINIIIFRSGVKINREVLTAGPNLRYLIRAGSGLDNLDMACANEKHLIIKRIPEPGAKAVAELTFGLMISLSRHIVKADQELKKGHWLKQDLKGYLLRGKVLGIVGAGNIGSLIGQMGYSWGMEVLGCVADEDNTPEVKADLSEKGIRLTTFEEVVKNADYLTVHVPLTNGTRNLINKEVIGMMKPGSYLTCLARGGVVNEKDLLNELENGNTLRGAGLDVHEKEGEGLISPLANLSNVILTPHIGAQTFDSQKEIGDIVLETVEYFENQESKLINH